MTITTLSAHYAQLLELTHPWIVEHVTLDLAGKRVTIQVRTLTSTPLTCPTCGATCPLRDLRPERTWRHLDTMQFETMIVAEIPRIRCKEHGILSLHTPWAGTRSRYTLLFERFAIEVMQATANTTAASTILRLSWDQLHDIRTRAVTRGLTRRKDEEVTYVGVDEKSFLKGHHYVSLATDLDRGRVLEVVEGRKKEDAIRLLRCAIPEDKRGCVQAGAMDMWDGFMSAWRVIFGPDSPIVHDKFHVAKYLGTAVDSVRKKEHRTFLKDGASVLTKTKYLWLKNPDTWEADEKKQFKELMQDHLKVGRAWALKEAFQAFWEYAREWSARRFFDRWYFRATHSRLDPIIKVAKMLKRHLAGLLAYMEHAITNAVTEGLNAKIQTIKSNARGFRNFQNYRIAILFHCGKLEMMP